MPKPNKEGEKDRLLQSVRSCIANRPLMEALDHIIGTDDEVALATLRGFAPGTPESLEAHAVLLHNERFRNWFRQASIKGDPFGH